MRRVAFLSVLLLITGVMLGGTVFHDPVASVAAAVDKTVFVTNGVDHPVPVTSSDDPARQAFAFFKNDSWDSGDDSHSVVFTVPAGKRLVIQAVSIQALLDPNGQQLITAVVQAVVNGQIEDYLMAPIFTGKATIGLNVYTVSQPTTIYADGGTEVRAGAAKSGFSGGGALNVSIHGYLIDCTVAACQ
jgi:hypothetical protein